MNEVYFALGCSSIALNTFFLREIYRQFMAIRKDLHDPERGVFVRLDRLERSPVPDYSPMMTPRVTH